jgi:hypothetical protein
MDTKAAFEKWFTPKFESMMRNGLGITAIKRRRELYWEAYQASRAAIEIELPEEYESESYLGNGCCDDYANTKIAACRKAITSHGIRIKGKTE